jgi:hypothetical protein
MQLKKQENSLMLNLIHYTFFIHRNLLALMMSYFLLGKDNKNREILLAPEAIISAEGQASTKSFSWGWNPTERQSYRYNGKIIP